MALPLRYNWRNLIGRKVSTSLTFLAVAVVVFVLTVLLSFAAGIRASLATTGSAGNIIVLAKGATAESTSIILPSEVGQIIQTPGITRDAGGALLLSREIAVQTSIARLGSQGNLANVAVRGVDDVGFALRPEVRVIEGRAFRQGAQEIIVGQAARTRFANLNLGDEVALGRLGNRLFRVVGVFESGGSALESEIWAPRTMIADVYRRRLVSCVLLRLTDPSKTEEAVTFINGPAVGLYAQTETEYYEDLSFKTREIVVLTTILVSIMAAGAVFAIANTMYAAVDGRRREIAMLRTIGFNRRSIVSAFLIESLIICVSGCLAGLAGGMLLNGSQEDFLSDTTWTVLAYELRVTPRIIATALGLAATVGIVGAMAPAVRAARTPIIEALRKA